MQANTNLTESLARGFRSTLLELDRATSDSGLVDQTRALVHLRASQIKGCSGCVELHLLKLLEAGESETRILSLEVWRKSTCFSEAERAALALTEELIEVDCTGKTGSEQVWAEARRWYDDQVLAALVLQITKVNAWRGLDAAIRRMDGLSGGR